MAIKVLCTCGKKLAVKDELAGKKVKCPECQKLLSIPKPKVQAESLDDEWDLEDSAEEDFDTEDAEAPAQSRGVKKSSRESVSREGNAKGKGKTTSAQNHRLVIGLSAMGGVLVVALLAWMLLSGRQKLANRTDSFFKESLTLEGHTNAVTSVAFSPDGQRLASASGDQTVKVWDATTGQESLTLKGHTHQVWSVAYSPDGQRLASASFDKTVKVWDVTPRARSR